MKEVILARSAGFCAGVDRSVKLAQKGISEHGSLWSLGELIHNRDEVARLENEGLSTAASVEEIPDGAVVIIRAHGVGREEYAALEKKGCRVIDGTCVKVAKVHSIAAEAEKEGRQLLIIGDRNHPEVIGIAGFCEGAKVFSDGDELENGCLKNLSDRKCPFRLFFRRLIQKKFLLFAKI